MTHAPTPVWVQLDFDDYATVIEATSGLRTAATHARTRGNRATADELDRLADELGRVLALMQTAYRDSHPPGEKKQTARTVARGSGGGEANTCRADPVSTRIVPNDYRDETP